MAPARRLGRRTTAEQALHGVDVKGKVAIVTGGNSGIGLETCRALAKAGARVYLCARSKEVGEQAVADIKSSGGSDVRMQLLDLADLDSVRKAAEELAAAEPAVQMLILNAGVMACPLTRTKQGLELQTGVNHVAHFHLTQLLLPRLKEAAARGGPGSARVVSVSSMAESFRGMDADDLNWEARAQAGQYSPWGAYAQSKLANLLFARELAKRLEGSGVLAFSLHPGMIVSNLQRHSFMSRVALWLLWPWTKTQPQGASTSVYAATAPDLTAADSGAYLDNCRVAVSSAPGRDPQLAAKVWAATEALLGRALEEGGIRISGQGEGGPETEAEKAP